MNYFHLNSHIGSAPNKSSGRYRYFVALSFELCYPPNTYVIKDSKDPQHKTFRSTNRNQLKLAVRIMNKECKL